ncbi:hypothetical protein CTI12_AA611510 [Artemisia annua]|uniref:Uncharacterized protein n=1 Tax=Artemisia annua TaxID=35608 RepID=A0A2U1KEN1_ARTAN|nr:hypothetical protein CTI12_AA611510 [Artemisia annua]
MVQLPEQEYDHLWLQKDKVPNDQAHQPHAQAHTLCRGFAPSEVANDRAEQYQGKVTTYVIIACIVAAVGGSIFLL